MQLRDYQLNLYNKAQNEFRNGKKRVLVVAPAGAGKSYIFAKMCETASKKGEVLILIHRLELKKQHEQLFNDLNINTTNIRIESVFTEVNNLDKHKKPVLIVLDEAHLSKAKSWEKVVKYYDTYTIGFTASPVRLDNKPLGDIFESLVEDVDVKWLIENKRLAPYLYYAPMSVNVDNIKTSMGDYNIIELEKLMSDNTIYSDIIKSYKSIADNEQCIVYCVNIKHSRETAQKFIDAGYSAECLDSEMNKKDREKIMNDFRNGKITILCNCGIISEGISIDNVSVCMLLRATQSLALNIQQSMRCMRYKDGKIAKIIDCVGNYTRHGLPDTSREWSLTSSPKKTKLLDENGDYKIRVCQNCFRTFKTAPVCPYCGEKYELKPREIEAKENIRLAQITAEEMAKIEQEKKKKRMEVGMAKTYEELIKIGKERGYKNPYYWAEMIINSRDRNKTAYKKFGG